MNLSTDRRTFLKQVAMATATAAMSGGAGLTLAPRTLLGETRTDEQGVTWDKAPCRFCGTGCHVQVGVKEGRVVAIAGDLMADVNKGLLCVKGYHVGEVLYGKDRLTRPLLRKGDRYEPISWDEAIDLIAEQDSRQRRTFRLLWVRPMDDRRRSGGQ